MKMTISLIFIAVHSNEEYFFENYCTLCELGMILLYNYAFRPSCSQNVISPNLWLYIYIKLSSHADKSEVEEGSKGCFILFCQNL
jgi:hypothetical protein